MKESKSSAHYYVQGRTPREGEMIERGKTRIVERICGEGEKKEIHKGKKEDKSLGRTLKYIIEELRGS